MKNRVPSFRRIRGQEEITHDTCYPDVVSMEAEPYPSLGIVGEVLRVVEPPRAVIVPEMVVRVFADANGQFRCFLGASGCCHTSNSVNKKPPVPIRKRR